MAEYQVALQDCERFEMSIRCYARDGKPVILKDMGNDAEGKPVFGVFIEAKRFFFFGPYQYQLGTVAEKWGKFFRSRIADGHRIEQAFIASHYFHRYWFNHEFEPEEREKIELWSDRPLELGVRVSLLVVGSWEMKQRKKPQPIEQWLP